MPISDRVLCMDGGGIKGLNILEVLEAIEKEADKPIIELFDWIGGTSTGGIIALGIATGKSVFAIRAIYTRLKDQVFKGSPPYDSELLETLMKREFGATSVMTDITKAKVLVTSVLGDHKPWKLHLFRSYQDDTTPEEDRSVQQFERIKPPNETYIWEVARSTSAAPTYFHPYKQFYDGGIMSNNPTLDMLTEIEEYNARQTLKDKSRSLGVVVSIGCGYVEYAKQPIKDPYTPGWWDYIRHPINSPSALIDKPGFLNDLLDQVSISNGQPSHRARAWCNFMKVPFHRFSPVLAKNVPLDCVDKMVLEKMLQDTRAYIEEQNVTIKEVARDLKAGTQAYIEDQVHHEKPLFRRPLVKMSVKPKIGGVSFFN